MISTIIFFLFVRVLNMPESLFLKQPYRRTIFRVNVRQEGLLWVVVHAHEHAQGFFSVFLPLVFLKNGDANFSACREVDRTDGSQFFTIVRNGVDNVPFQIWIGCNKVVVLLWCGHFLVADTLMLLSFAEQGVEKINMLIIEMGNGCEFDCH